MGIEKVPCGRQVSIPPRPSVVLTEEDPFAGQSCMKKSHRFPKKEVGSVWASARVLDPHVPFDQTLDLTDGIPPFFHAFDEFGVFLLGLRVFF